MRTADAALAVAAAIVRPFARRDADRRSDAEPQRILLLRLERIGDLLMALEAIRDVRALAPAARDRSGRRQLECRARAARFPRSIASRRSTRAGWRGRATGSGCRPPARRPALAHARLRSRDQLRARRPQQPRGGRRRARRTAGFASGGGGPLLDVALDYDPTTHTTDNARRLVAARVRPDAPGARAAARWRIPETATAAAAARLRRRRRTAARRRARQRRARDQAVARRNGSRTSRRVWPMPATRPSC